ncbi:MAG: hypothetical protein QM687_03210 [Ferruginibacter sp.]
MTLKQRFQSPTPRFFREVSRWGLLLAATGGTLLASPVELPPLVLQLAGYLTVAGAVATAVSQAGTTAEEGG